MTTEVIHIRDMPKGGGSKYVFIGRPSIWGNPFVLPKDANDETRKVIVWKFREYLKHSPQLVGKARKELQGKVLVCYCKPKECHGDVLAAIAEGEEP
jgi:hypothetical protein